MGLGAPRAPRNTALETHTVGTARGVGAPTGTAKHPQVRNTALETHTVGTARGVGAPTGTAEHRQVRSQQHRT